MGLPSGCRCAAAAGAAAPAAGRLAPAAAWGARRLACVSAASAARSSARRRRALVMGDAPSPRVQPFLTSSRCGSPAALAPRLVLPPCLGAAAAAAAAAAEAAAEADEEEAPPPAAPAPLPCAGRLGALPLWGAPGVVRMMVSSLLSARMYGCSVVGGGAEEEGEDSVGAGEEAGAASGPHRSSCAPKDLVSVVMGALVPSTRRKRRAALLTVHCSRAPGAAGCWAAAASGRAAAAAAGAGGGRAAAVLCGSPGRREMRKIC